MEICEFFRKVNVCRHELDDIKCHFDHKPVGPSKTIFVPDVFTKCLCFNISMYKNLVNNFILF